MRLLLALLLVLAAPLLASAQPSDAARRAGSFALRAGRVITAAAQGPWALEKAVIIVRDGKIVAIGKDVAIPPDLRVIDLPDATVMPGLVAAASAPLFSQGPESIRAAYRAADAFDRFDDFRRTLAAGVTTMHLSPGWNRLLSGRGAVVRLAGPGDLRVLSADADLSITLGETAFNPPPLIDLLVPPSSDNAIKPAEIQRPSTRLGQYLALKEAIQGAMSPAPGGAGAKFDVNLAALGEAWRANTPVRIQAQRAADIAGAINFLASNKRAGYIVGGLESGAVADQLAGAGVALVYTLSVPFRAPGRDLGNDPDALQPDPRVLASLARVRLALGVAPDQPVTDLRLAAATALRAGLSPQRVIDAITRVPAEILGVAARVGSLEVGKDADLLVLSGDPLATSTHVRSVYILGRLAYSSDMERARDDRAGTAGGTVVVHGGTVWLGPNQWLDNGSVLIENGKITQVGHGVATPPGARVIDAGPDAFITPGFIDAFGHLGLEGDNNSTGPDASLSRIIGVADEAELRVARAGVTTVMLAPYRAGGSGSQISAVKTAGTGREERVVAPTAGLVFDLGDTDPIAVAERFRPRLEAGKKYAETWKKYQQDLADWEKKRAEGQVIEQAQPKIAEEAAPLPKDDPITGRWNIKITSPMTPDERAGKIALRLTGSRFEGRVVEPAVQVDVKIVGELDGKRLTGRIEVESRGLGYPTFEGTLDREDHAAGTISIQNVPVQINFDMTRIDKGDVEFKVETSRKRRTTGKDGRPLPPKVDDALEPFRAVVEKRIPLVVSASGPAQIDAVLDLLADQYDVPLVLLGASAPNGAAVHAERLVKKEVGVIAPTGVLQRDKDKWTMPLDDFSRRGIRVALQSNAEDAARTLPGVALYAVERGLSPEAALAALTIDPAKMYHLDQHVGQIAPGREGDLVIFSGHPFQTNTTIRRVIISGNEVEP